MKKFSIVVEDDLYEIITKDSISHNISKAEAVRLRLVEAYFTSEKQEEKIAKKLESFEKKVHEFMDEKFSMMSAQSTRNLTYVLTNHHLIKMILRDVVCTEMSAEEQTETVREYVSQAKGLAIKTHPIDSLHSKENITKNIFPTDFN